MVMQIKLIVVVVVVMTKEEDKRQISWRKSRGLNKENKM